MPLMVSDEKSRGLSFRRNTAQELLKKLLQDASQCTSSTLMTAANALDLIENLCAPEVRADLATNPPIRMLVVDDDLMCRRAIAVALQMAFKKPETAENGGAAVNLAMERPYDVIFMDVQMPGMNGFTACRKIHETVLNRMTPVVFVTCCSEFEARSQSTASGGAELIGKPFLTAEITVKALTYALLGRIQKRGTSPTILERSGSELPHPEDGRARDVA